jgi:hypothetical protein
MSVALIAALLLANDPAQSPFDYFVGKWSCEGYFVASKKPLASDIEFNVDSTTGQLIKRHIDRAPGQYRAAEMWTTNPDHTKFRAAITDTSGMRWYTTTGWVEDRLVWSRSGAGEPGEQFAYARKDPDTMTIEWWIARDGKPLAMGDTLTCKRAR